MDSYEKKQLKYKIILSIIMTICITVVITASVTFYMTTKNQLGNRLNLSKVDINSQTNTTDGTINAISGSLKSFRELIDRYYIGDIDENKMLDETIKGYVNGLGDKYSEYMTKAEWEEFQEQALGNYYGIGIYMSTNEAGNIVITSVIKGSPAEEVGIKAEDIIAAIDDVSYVGKTPSDASTAIKGSENSKVKLTVFRNGEYLDFDVERREIKIYHVEGEMLENDLAYISLVTFDEGCAEEFKTELEKLRSQGAKKLILDLRYNTGGLVDEALEIANMFIEKDKTLLYTMDANDNKTETKSTKDPIASDMEMVVLVNYYSASSSEILTGALKDHKKATVVGEKTYGKGVIQNVFELTDGSVLKLTTAEYFTPNEIKINEQGIEPDYVVKLPEKEDENKTDTQLEKAKELLK